MLVESGVASAEHVLGGTLHDDFDGMLVNLLVNVGNRHDFAFRGERNPGLKLVTVWALTLNHPVMN